MITNKKSIIAILLLSLEFILYIKILFIDGLIDNDILCFTSIALCFLSSLLFIKQKETRLETIALFFTLIADFFLVLIDQQNKEVGVSFFLIVQLCHLLYIHTSLDKQKIKYSMVLRIGCSIIGLILCFLVLKEKVDYLSIVSLLYFIELLFNILFSFFRKEQKRISIVLFSSGLICFILCDIFVGMAVLLDSYIVIEETSFLYGFFHPSFNLVWFFYIPSQTLLTLNIILNGEKNAKSY